MISFLCHTLGPHHASRFNELGKKRTDFSVLEIVPKREKYPWKYDKSAIAFKYEKIETGDNSIENFVLKHLSANQSSVVVFEGYHSQNLDLIKIAQKCKKDLKIKTIVQIDSWHKGLRRRWYREFIKKILIPKFFDRAFVSGTRSFNYALNLGFSAKNIWAGVDVVDNNFFSTQADAIRSQPNLCIENDLPNDYFLCIARFSPEKNLIKLVSAFSRYKASGGKWKLVIIGDGPQKADLVRHVACSCHEDCSILSWQSYLNLPLYYAFASCFILPSTYEPWGLVASEAAASGLPLLLSENCGSCYDLVVKGVNGFCFDPTDSVAMAEVMLKVNACNLEAMGENSKRIVSKFSLENWVYAIEDCISSLE